VVVGLVVAALVVARSDGIDHPDEWDERVVDLAAFVEEARGLDFEHPVTVEFLTDDEYSARATVDESTLTDEDRAAVEESGTVLAALGLVPADTDMFATGNDMADTGTLAFYDPVTETVTVRGTEMTTGIEVTLVHELVHVAQDQAFDLEKPPPDSSNGAVEAFDALVEGDAVRIELDYVESLDPDEQDAYWAAYEQDYEESSEGLTEVPSALQALFAAPYVLGQPLVDLIVEDGGNDAVDAAFDEPPTSSEHLLDPRAYFAGDAPVEVDEPAVPDGADEIGEAGPLGATTLYVMLAARIDPLEALTAADGWGGDTHVAFRDDDQTCVLADLVGDTQSDTDEIAAALEAWVDAGPPGAAYVVRTPEGRVRLESCGAAAGDGEAAPASGVDALDALAVPATRSQLMAMATTSMGLDPDEAFAVGDCFVRRLPLDELTEANGSAELPPELSETIDTTMAACMAE